MEDGKTTWATNPDVSQLRVKTVKSCNQGTFENLPSRPAAWRAARSAGCFLEKSGLKAAESGFVPEARRESSASNSEDFLSWTTSHETLTKRGETVSPTFSPGPLSHLLPAPGLVPLCAGCLSLRCRGQCTHMNPYTKPSKVCWKCRDCRKCKIMLKPFLSALTKVKSDGGETRMSCDNAF